MIYRWSNEKKEKFRAEEFKRRIETETRTSKETRRAEAVWEDMKKEEVREKGERWEGGDEKRTAEYEYEEEEDELK